MHALVRAVLVTAVALGTVMIPHPAASAASPIGLSADGSTFASTLPYNLFDSVGDLVPGDSSTVRFWLRNQSSETAYLRMALRDAEADDPAYFSALSMVVAINGVRGIRTSFADATQCSPLVVPTRIRPGEIVLIDAALELADLPGTSAQASRASMRMNVALSDAAIGDESSAGCVAGGIDIPINEAGPTDTSTSTPVAIDNEFVVIGPLLSGWLPLWPILGFAGGVVLFILLRRRQADDDDEDANDKAVVSI